MHTQSQKIPSKGIVAEKEKEKVKALLLLAVMCLEWKESAFCCAGAPMGWAAAGRRRWGDGDGGEDDDDEDECGGGGMGGVVRCVSQRVILFIVSKRRLGEWWYKALRPASFPGND